MSARIPLLLAALLAFAPALRAENRFVIVGGTELTFQPQTLTITAGDSVTFINFGGFHNVMADDGSFRCARGCDGDGQGGNGNSSSGVWSATVPFPTAGTYGYFCEAHGAPGEGMYGTVLVEAAPAPAPISVPVSPIGALPFCVALAALLVAAASLRRGRIKRGT